MLDSAWLPLRDQLLFVIERLVPSWPEGPKPQLENVGIQSKMERRQVLLGLYKDLG